MSDYRVQPGRTTLDRICRSQLSAAPLHPSPGAPSHGTRVEVEAGLPFRPPGLPRNLLGSRSIQLDGYVPSRGRRPLKLAFVLAVEHQPIKLHGSTL